MNNRIAIICVLALVAAGATYWFTRGGASPTADSEVAETGATSTAPSKTERATSDATSSVSHKSNNSLASQQEKPNAAVSQETQKSAGGLTTAAAGGNSRASAASRSVTEKKGARSTGMASSSPNGANAASETMYHPGQMVTARVASSGKSFDLVPDQVGVLEMHEPVQLKNAVEIEVAYPEADIGAKVVAAVEDGGQLEDAQRVVKLQLDDRRKASFKFTTSEGRGLHRITLRCGADIKTIQLWAGEPLVSK